MATTGTTNSPVEGLVIAAAAGRSPWKLSCRVVATSNVTLAGTQTIDGVALALGDEVLCAGQTAGAQNGPYVVAAGAWPRRTDMDSDAEAILGSTFYIREGTEFAATTWTMSSPTTGSILLGSTSMSFSQAVGSVQSQALTLPLVIDSDRESTYAGSSALVLALASSGHVDGKTKTIVVPHATASSLILANDLNATGDATINAAGLVTDFDTAADYLIAVSRFGGRCVSVVRNLGTLDVAAPTIVSATVSSGAPSSLVVVFNEPVYLPSLTGLSLSFSVGTARTITALASGNGTTTLTFTLSGAFTGPEVCSLVIGSTRLLQDMNGNLIAAGSTSVTVSFGFAALTPMYQWLVTSGVALSGANVTSWTDMISGLVLTGTAGLRPTYAANDGDGSPAITFDGISQYLDNTATRAFDPNADFSIAAIMSYNTQYVVFDQANTAGSNRVRLYYSMPSKSVTLDLVDDVAGIDAGPSQVSPGAGTWGSVVTARRAGTTLKMNVDGGTTVTTTRTTGTITSNRFSVGQQWNAGAYIAGGGFKLRGLLIFNRALSDADKDSLRTIARATFPGL